MTRQRLDYIRLAADSARALAGVTRAAVDGGLDPALVHLTSLRASQLNGCAYCVDLHYRDGRAAGTPPRKLNAVAAWREAPFFDERERAALAWTEALTRLGPEGVPEHAWERMRGCFDDGEAARLTFAIAAINAWNRVSIAMGRGPDIDE